MAELNHKRCGGTISVDIANGFTLRTHSLILTPIELKLGVLELNAKPTTSIPIFVCNKCDTRFTADNNFEGVVSLCLTCSKKKPVGELYTSYPFPSICEDCIKDISGESNGKSKLSEYFDISLSSIKFTPLVDVLKKIYA